MDVKLLEGIPTTRKTALVIHRHRSLHPYHTEDYAGKPELLTYPKDASWWSAGVMIYKNSGAG